MCGIQMYYEVGVVKKFQVPQEVSIHDTWNKSHFLFLDSEAEEIFTGRYFIATTYSVTVLTENQL